MIYLRNTSISVYPIHARVSPTVRLVVLADEFGADLPQLYLPCASTANQPERILEVVKIGGSKRRTWFIGDSKIEGELSSACL